ncbi:MAG: sigma-70 family RNA polymerase sigma factor [Myxococcales bacterium]|nr:sigma-70 family RNA polymerase sigma factor [Myxococcales bacterium]
MDAASEPELVAAARAGDDAALAALIKQHQDRIYRFGLRMCRDPEDARDVLQETLLALARGVKDFRSEASLSTWLYTVARSHCIKARRRSKFAPAQVGSLDGEASATVVDPAPGPAQALSDRRLAAALEDAIAALEPSHREVLVLRDVEGLAAAEVAEVLAISVDAVKSRLHRARAAVRAALAPLAPVSAPAPATSCPDVVALWSRQLEGDISAEACAAMEAHLQGCPRCAGTCAALRETLALCQTTPAPVPAAVQARVRVALDALRPPR